MRTTSSLRPIASVAFSRRGGNGVQRLGVRIVGTGGRLADDAARRHEAGDVVDVPVGVVVLQAFVDPDDLLGAEGFGERLLGGFLRPAVAVGIEQRLRGGQDRAFPVMIDGAAFEDEIETADGRLRKLGDVVADGRVVGKIVLAAPAVRLEAEGDGVLAGAREDRAGVAQPDVAVLARG